MSKIKTSLCKWCKTECKRFFCSKKCNNAFHKDRGKVKTACLDCGKTRYRHVYELERYPYCLKCGVKRSPRNQEGNKNPAWRGGSKYWEKGRYGKDKDGLSWKKQRKLAWERDKYACKKCGIEKDARNPDVHHKVPYRISKSHALKNLVCLCKKCHKIEDEKYKQIIGP